MQKIYIVRHGQDKDSANGIWNGRRDPELTELGIQQAQKTARKFEHEAVDCIYTSPLKRAHQTASIIADHLGVKEVRIENDLIERECGILTGKPFKTLKDYAKKTFESHGVTYYIEADGAESFLDLRKRAASVLKNIRLRNAEKNILIVAHAGIGRMMRAAYYGWTWEEELNQPPLPPAGVLELSSPAPDLRDNQH